MAFDFDNQEAVDSGTEFKREDEVVNTGSNETNDSNEETQQTIAVDLFGDPLEEEEIKPANNKEKKTATAKATTTKSSAPKLKNKEKFGPEYKIAYARWSANVPHEDMTLDDLREWLETEYPEFSNQRTSWNVDREAKVLTPNPYGGKKG